MNLRTSEGAAAGTEVRLPAEVDWRMLDKSRFFVLGTALFSGVSATLYPAVVLKTRQQVAAVPLSCTAVGAAIVRTEGLRGLYRGFATSLAGTVPARALYMGALEVTKCGVGNTALRLGVSEPLAAALANAAAGVAAAVAAQTVWTPVDVISQRLMVAGASAGGGGGLYAYRGGVDAFRRILRSEGVRGLYRGFGISIVTYAPSNALWWASYCLVQRMLWRALAVAADADGSDAATAPAPETRTVVAVQGASAAIAGGFTAVVTTPLDTIKTRVQVLQGAVAADDTMEKKQQQQGRRRPLGVAETVRRLVKEGGWAACYRGLGPRWAAMSMSATTMITTYEFLKRMSAKTSPLQEQQHQ